MAAQSGLGASGSQMGDESKNGDDNRPLRGLTASAVIKFNNFFKQNLVKLLVEEAKRDQIYQEAQQAPKYSVCFSDLALFLGLKDEVNEKVAQMEDDGDSINSVSPSYFRQEAPLSQQYS
eukprot:CAMPEP_0170459270 /NCGR_PEP_ID=MMETSP0123-20130129/6024_1 /TAXON_ID=182087 /ORGANISM="Favella ehrenbergii, Strain Fehren 1" /LENGTH=119 /DNA_ID=CAMNT_0010723819 /DNA_START=276 /DNA_END=635 /DNA_ORIENTATION=+